MSLSFLSHPREIRDQIYLHALLTSQNDKGDEPPVYTLTPRGIKHLPTTLLQSNLQLRHEALLILCSRIPIRLLSILHHDHLFSAAKIRDPFLRFPLGPDGKFKYSALIQTLELDLFIDISVSSPPSTPSFLHSLLSTIPQLRSLYLVLWASDISQTEEDASCPHKMPMSSDFCERRGRRKGLAVARRLGLPLPENAGVGIRVDLRLLNQGWYPPNEEFQIAIMKHLTSFPHVDGGWVADGRQNQRQELRNKMFEDGTLPVPLGFG